MNILIDNAGFINKGAELMLNSVVSKIKEQYLDSNIVINSHTISGKNYLAIGKGFYILKDLKLLNYLIPQKILDKLYYTKINKINFVLDAGGFQFSDQWANTYSKKSNKNLEKYYSNLKNGCAKIFFLPQAFGPFTHPLAIERIKIIYKYADLIFAREKTSYNYLIELFGEQNKIILKPDFTNLLKPSTPLTNFVESKKYIGIIPNQKMITHTDKVVSSSYIPNMIKLCQLLIDRGESLILLNHEGEGDEKIIDEIQRGLSKPQIKLSGLNANEVKATIGKMKILISSRYHGVVSGLSQGICTFSTGWSHKYQELLIDYNVTDNFLDISNLAICKTIISAALDENTDIYNVKSEIIKLNENKSLEMWHQVLTH